MTKSDNHSTCEAGASKCLIISLTEKILNWLFDYQLLFSFHSLINRWGIWCSLNVTQGEVKNQMCLEVKFQNDTSCFYQILSCGLTEAPARCIQYVLWHMSCGVDWPTSICHTLRPTVLSLCLLCHLPPYLQPADSCVSQEECVPASTLPILPVSQNASGRWLVVMSPEGLSCQWGWHITVCRSTQTRWRFVFVNTQSKWSFLWTCIYYYYY